MSETKAFPTVDVLGCVTGRLLSDIGGIYQVLNWMTDSSLYTHQLPRVCREAVPVVLAIHPHLSEAIVEAEHVTAENFQTWRDLWLDRYGPEIAVPRMTEDQHERIDALSELAEKFNPQKIIVVRP